MLLKDKHKSSPNVHSDHYDDSYSDDAFDNHDDEYVEEDNEIDDKIVDEEIYLNTSIGKKDAEALKEILHK